MVCPRTGTPPEKSEGDGALLRSLDAAGVRLPAHRSRIETGALGKTTAAGAHPPVHGATGGSPATGHGRQRRGAGTQSALPDPAGDVAGSPGPRSATDSRVGEPGQPGGPPGGRNGLQPAAEQAPQAALRRLRCGITGTALRLL